MAVASRVFLFVLIGIFGLATVAGGTGLGVDPSQKEEWRPVVIGGFANPANEHVLSTAIFSGDLYVGTYNDLGFEVWRLWPVIDIR